MGRVGDEKEGRKRGMGICVMEMTGKGGDEIIVTGMKTKDRLLRWEGGVQGKGCGGR